MLFPGVAIAISDAHLYRDVLLSAIVITPCLKTTKTGRPITRVANSHIHIALLTDFGLGTHNFLFNHRHVPLGNLGPRSRDAPAWLILFFWHFNCCVWENIHIRSLEGEMELSQPRRPVTPSSVPIGELEGDRRLAIKDAPSISGRDTYT